MRIVSKFLLLAMLALFQAQAATESEDQEKKVWTDKYGRSLLIAGGVCLAVVGFFLYRHFWVSAAPEFTTYRSMQDKQAKKRGEDKRNAGRPPFRLNANGVKKLFDANGSLCTGSSGKLESIPEGFHIEFVPADSHFYLVTDKPRQSRSMLLDFHQKKPVKNPGFYLQNLDAFVE